MLSSMLNELIRATIHSTDSAPVSQGEAMNAVNRRLSTSATETAAIANCNPRRSCHGSPQSDFYLTCGSSDEQIQHNYVIAKSFVAEQTDRSEFLLRPLAVSAGGVNHSGGDVWTSASDDEFETLRNWARDAGPLQPADDSPEFQYFAARVMPVLLRRGCAMPQCHSPQGFNDFRLRAGSRGFFSPLALRRTIVSAATSATEAEISVTSAGLFDRHRLGEVARLVDVGSHENRGVVGQKLHRQRIDHRRDQLRYVW